MKRYLVLLLLDDANNRWGENDVARYVAQCDEDEAVSVKEIPQGKWKTVKKKIEGTVKNKGKEVWKVFGLG